MEKEEDKFSFLKNSLTKLENCENLIILDFFHYVENSTTNTNNRDNEYALIEKHLMSIKEVCFLDENIIYLIFVKPHVVEISDSNSKIRKFLLETLKQNKNIFIENKLNNMHFLTGFAIGRGITNYLFIEENSHNWLSVSEVNYSNKIKLSNFDFMKVTLEYMLREKRRNYNKGSNKQPSKLTQLFSGETVSQPTQKQSNLNEESDSNILYNDVKCYAKFNQIVENIISYFMKSPPNSFKIMKNIITNFSEQNSSFFFKNYKIKEEVLSFMLFYELVNRGIIINRLVSKLLNERIITSLDEIDSMLIFFVSFEGEQNDQNSTEQENTSSKIENKIKQPNKRKKQDLNTFSISSTAEDEYRTLLSTCTPICNYVSATLLKILCSFGLSQIDKLPTNPTKYKNYILSYVNNQELLKISKKILNLDYEKIVTTLTEGIIIELMRNNLVVFISDKKIHYNVLEIEAEKYRMQKIIKY